MAHLHGLGGQVYANSTVIEDCEDAWNEGGEDAGSTTSTTAGKVGTNAARSTTVGVGTTALLMSEAISSTNYSDYDAVVFYFRSSLTFSAGDMALLLDDTAICASPIETLLFPAYGTADVWQRVLIRLADAANLTTIISVGLRQVTDLADGTFDMDDVRAVKLVDGMREWSITYTGDTAEVTDFQSSGTKEYIAGPTGWTATFSGFKDSAPLGFNSEVVLAFEEGSTVGNSWTGNAIIDSLAPATPVDGVVSYTYGATGTGDLQIAVS